MRKQVKAQAFCSGEEVTLDSLAARDWSRFLPEHMKPADVDHMPREVALSMLCAPKVPSTNRERKTWKAALANYYVSDREPKSLETKVASRLRRSTLAQLGKWLRRATQKRRDLQSRFQSLKKKSDAIQDKLADKSLSPADKHGWETLLALAVRAMRAVDLQALSVDSFCDALNEELRRRKTCCGSPLF